MADIIVDYRQDILSGVQDLLEASCLKSMIHSGMKISIKPNMVLASPPSSGATTHAEVVEGLILYLKDFGVKDIEIIESAWVGDDTKKAYHICGYDKLSKKYNIPLYDLKDDRIVKIDAGEYRFEVFRKSIETDFLINVPVLKAHCQTKMTCCLKNMKGCISDSEKRRFHALGLHRPIAYLNKAVKTHFCLVDGICGDLTFEEGGNPVQRDMILTGADPLAVDSYCAGLIGYKADEIEYLRIAHTIGVGRLFDGSMAILELNKSEKPVIRRGASVGTVRRLAAHINEDSACSSCYASLIHALYRGKIPKEKINVGQGFRGIKGKIGCGNCTSKCEKYVPGCPPKATEIIEFLNKL